MTKTLTTDCQECKSFKIDDEGNFKCSWGNTKKPKVLLPPKGKKSIRCKLKKE